MVSVVFFGDDLTNAEQVLEAQIPRKVSDKIAVPVEERRAMTPALQAIEDQNS